MNISGQPSFTNSVPESLFYAFLTNQLDYGNEIQDFQQRPGHAVVCPELCQDAEMHLDLATYYPHAHKSPLSYSATVSHDPVTEFTVDNLINTKAPQEETHCDEWNPYRVSASTVCK